MWTYNFGQLLDGYVSLCFANPLKKKQESRPKEPPWLHIFIQSFLAIFCIFALVATCTILVNVGKAHKSSMCIGQVLKATWAPNVHALDKFKGVAIQQAQLLVEQIETAELAKDEKDRIKEFEPLVFPLQQKQRRQQQNPTDDVLMHGVDAIYFNAVASIDDVATWIYYGLLPSLANGILRHNVVIGDAVAISVDTSAQASFYKSADAIATDALVAGENALVDDEEQQMQGPNVSIDAIVMHMDQYEAKQSILLNAFNRGIYWKYDSSEGNGDEKGGTKHCHTAKCHYDYIDLTLPIPFEFKSLLALLQAPTSKACTLQFYTASPDTRTIARIQVSFDLQRFKNAAAAKRVGAGKGENAAINASALDVGNAKVIDVDGIVSLSQWFQGAVRDYISVAFSVLVSVFILHGIWFHVRHRFLKLYGFYICDFAARALLTAAVIMYMLVVYRRFDRLPKIVDAAVDTPRYQCTVSLANSDAITFQQLVDGGMRTLYSGIDSALAASTLLYFISYFAILALTLLVFLLTSHKKSLKLHMRFGLYVCVQTLAFVIGLSFAMVSLSLANAYIINFTKSALESLRLNIFTVINILSGTINNDTLAYLQHVGFMHAISIVVLFFVAMYLSSLLFCNLLETWKCKSPISSFSSTLQGPFDAKRLITLKHRYFKVMRRFSHGLNVAHLRSLAGRNTATGGKSTKPNLQLPMQAVRVQPQATGIIVNKAASWIKGLCYTFILIGACVFATRSVGRWQMVKMLKSSISNGLTLSTVVLPYKLTTLARYKWAYVPVQTQVTINLPNGSGLSNDWFVRSALANFASSFSSTTNDEPMLLSNATNKSFMCLNGRFLLVPQVNPILFSVSLTQARALVKVGQLVLDCDGSGRLCSSTVYPSALALLTQGPFDDAIESIQVGMLLVDIGASGVSGHWRVSLNNAAKADDNGGTDGTAGKNRYRLYMASCRFLLQKIQPCVNIKVRSLATVHVTQARRNYAFYAIYGCSSLASLVCLVVLIFDVMDFIKQYRRCIGGRLSRLDLTVLYLINSCKRCMHVCLLLALGALVLIYTFILVHVEYIYNNVATAFTVDARQLLDVAVDKARWLLKQVWLSLGVVVTCIIGCCGDTLVRILWILFVCLYKQGAGFVASFLGMSLLTGALLVYLCMFASSYIQLHSQYFIRVAISIIFGDGHLPDELFQAPLSHVVYGACMLTKAAIAMLLTASLWSAWPRPQAQRRRQELQPVTLPSQFESKPIMPSVLLDHQLQLLSPEIIRAGTSECMALLQRFREYNSQVGGIGTRMSLVKSIHEALGQELHALSKTCDKAAIKYAMAQYRIHLQKQRPPDDVQVDIARLEAILGKGAV